MPRYYANLWNKLTLDISWALHCHCRLSGSVSTSQAHLVLPFIARLRLLIWHFGTILPGVVLNSVYLDHAKLLYDNDDDDGKSCSCTEWLRVRRDRETKREREREQENCNQLVDAERYDDERQQEVGDGQTGDDAVRHVLEVSLQQQGQ